MLRDGCSQKSKRLFFMLVPLGIVMMLVSPIISFADESEAIFLSLKPQAPQSIDQAKNSLVRIQTGYVDENNRFHRIRSLNGVLVSNSQEGAYIISPCHGLKTHKKKYRDIEGFQTESIRVAVKGDVNDELTMVAESRRKDYCILRAENVIAEKIAVGIENDQPVSAGDDAVSLTYRKKNGAQDYLDYDAADVEKHNVTIRKCDGETVLEYDTDGSIDIGSPILNKDGYVIGFVNVKPSRQNPSKAIFCREVAEVLDNYRISYRNRLTENAYETLYHKCRADYKIIQSHDYDADSKSKLQIAVDQAIDVMREAPNDFDRLSEALLLLDRGERALKKKTVNCSMNLNN